MRFAVGFRIKLTEPAGLNFNADKYPLRPNCIVGQPALNVFTCRHVTPFHDTPHTEPVAPWMPFH